MYVYIYIYNLCTCLRQCLCLRACIYIYIRTCECTCRCRYGMLYTAYCTLYTVTLQINSRGKPAGLSGCQNGRVLLACLLGLQVDHVFRVVISTIYYINIYSVCDNILIS